MSFSVLLRIVIFSTLVLCQTVLFSQQQDQPPTTDSIYLKVNEQLKSNIDSAAQLFEFESSKLKAEKQIELYLLWIQDLTLNGENELALKYLTKGERIALENKTPFLGYGNLLKKKSQIYRDLVKYDSALLTAEKLIDVSRTLEESEFEIQGHVEKGTLQMHIGDDAIALQTFLKAIELCQKIENELLTIRVYKNVANLYAKIKEKEKANEYFKKVLAYSIKNNNLLDIAQVGNNYALALMPLGQYELADSILHIALEASQEMNTDFGVNITKTNLGTNAYHQKQYKEAEKYFRDSYEYFQQINHTYGMVVASFNLARIYLATDDYQSSVYFGEKALELGRSGQFMKEFTEILLNLSLAFEKIGRLEKALTHLKEYNTLKEEIDNNERNRELGRLESRIDLNDAKYQNQLLESESLAQRALLSQQTTQRNALLVGLGLLGIISLLIYRSQRQKSRLNKQLREAEETKTRWFVNVSHELKTPLTLVQGPMSQLLESDSLNEIDRKRLKLANRNLRNLQGLVTEILDLSRHEKGHLELVKIPTNLSEIINSTVASFESLAKVNKVQLGAQVSEDFWLEIDAGKVRKLVENLVSNALKFTHEGGSVEARMVRNVEAIEVIVKDTGEGISEEDLPHVFDRFYQSKEKIKSGQGGTGVGLSLAKEVAELHGGTLAVNSQPGEGSTFVLSLPVALMTEPGESINVWKEEMAEAPVAAKFKSRLKEKPSLLLVEDNADMRTYIEDVLKTEYKLTMTRDGKDALEQLKTASFDLVISDVMMPRMDGLELVKTIKEHEAWSKLPIIMLTALNTIDDRIHALRIGIDDYLGKPFNPEELKVRAANLLGNRSQRIEEEESEESGSFDDQLLRTLEEEVKNHLTDSVLSVNYLAEKANMSERSLRRYLKKTTGLSPLDFIQEIKLQKAMELLEKQTYPTLKEVANATGFDRSARLTAAFEKRFGKKPADYLTK